MRIRRSSSLLVVAAFALLVGAQSAAAQTRAVAAAEELARSRAALLDSTREFKASTEELLRFEEAAVGRAAKTAEQLRQLFAEGLLAKRELEEGERALAAAQSRLEETRTRINDADRLLAEVVAAEELAKSQPPPARSAQTRTNPNARYNTTANVIRYTGMSGWSVSNLGGLQTFFVSAFGRPLPTSAVGQTATHDRLGFDHRHAVDVAVHPDSAEGRALIEYLRSRGITFIAFRAAVPGSATGPHIHIGRPSQRIA